jgi:GNAT superfamily N-acetyltransferase
MRLAFLAEMRHIDVDHLSEDFVEVTRSFLSRAIEASTMHSWLAEEGGRCLGIVSLILADRPPAIDDFRTREGYIVNMYVDPLIRRRGVGRSLFDACIKSAPGFGVRRLFLRATDDGRPMYLTAGFKTDEAWMELRLPRPS